MIQHHPPSPVLSFLSSADRLLLQRLRKSQSTTVLYGEQPDFHPPSSSEVPLPPESTSTGLGGGGLYPQLDSGGSQRLIVVANRLPVSAYKDKGGQWQLQVSAGGLVSALMGVGMFQTKWIGWPGVWKREETAGGWESGVHVFRRMGTRAHCI
jgi:hypothetical protein